jgi:hypothetical protein
MEIDFDNEDPNDKKLFNDQPSESNLKENENEN